LNIKVKRLVLDVLKPREPQIYILASRLAEVKGVKDVSISVAEIDQQTETIKLSIEGESINVEDIEQRIEELGASVRSVDEVRVSR
jgi:hypothetical protein